MLAYKNAMEYMAALTLLVALGALLISSYLRLFRLYEQVQHRWRSWLRVTNQRNASICSFERYVASLPASVTAPDFELKHRAEESERALAAMQQAPSLGNLCGLSESERRLRCALRHVVRVLDALGDSPEQVELLKVGETLTLTLNQQTRVAAGYNHAVSTYNRALEGPVNGIVASVFGFHPAARLPKQ